VVGTDMPAFTTPKYCPMSSSFYRPFWNSLLRPGWRTALVLVLLWSLPRFAIVLEASRTGNYQWVSLIFLTMMAAPWVLLTKEGRRTIGIRRPRQGRWLALAFVLGALYSTGMFAVALGFFGDGEGNWFAYIARSYTNLPPVMSEADRRLFFLIYAAIGMTFSPIGEELFYRGLIHENFRCDLGERAASMYDSLAFALVHLAHFGIVYTAAGQWRFLPLPALLWVALLFGLCLTFSGYRRWSGSILGAILGHAGFNLAMNYLIFYIT